ncbi:hypothetical protein [Flavobacterium soyae]|uniref:hypothetical protein n=1 Tax=Flavobacterium soyae TaxID=2903098 RepID=UPI001E609EA6|nr:hypothetical protein [Flavobacterium soyae]MCD9577515.1 hypothetical protein [Flavobacterium soyae]
MQSKLSLSEFRARLKNNTQIGSPRLKLSPFSFLTIFDEHSKPFYGLFDDKDFRLTINYAATPTFFIIKGRYKIINHRLDVNYRIEPHPKFYLFWIKYMPITVLIFMNIMLFLPENRLIEAIIPVNIVLLFILFFSRWDTKRRRKNLEKKFIEIFEIE